MRTRPVPVNLIGDRSTLASNLIPASSSRVKVKAETLRTVTAFRV